MAVSQYTLRLPDGTPMAFPADLSRDDIGRIAQAYADGTATPDTRGRVRMYQRGPGPFADPFLIDVFDPITTARNFRPLNAAPDHGYPLPIPKPERTAMIRVDLTEEELRAVLELVAMRQDPDERNVLARVEFALDVALMEHENRATGRED